MYTTLFLSSFDQTSSFTSKDEFGNTHEYKSYRGSIDNLNEILLELVSENLVEYTSFVPVSKYSEIHHNTFLTENDLSVVKLYKRGACVAIRGLK